MRSLVRTFSAIALAALVTAAPAAAASKTAKPATWAKKHKLKGSWKAKDADRDGLKNLQEFKLATDPRKADSDRDGLTDGDEVKSANNPLKADSDRDRVKDGAEHAGVVTAFDGESITIRQFHGAKLTATIAEDAECVSVADLAPAGEDPSAEDADAGDEGFVPVDGEDEWVEDGDGTVVAESSFQEGEEDVIDLGGDDDFTAEDAGSDAGGCDMPDLKKGAVLRSAELETRNGVRYIVALELA